MTPQILLFVVLAAVPGIVILFPMFRARGALPLASIGLILCLGVPAFAEAPGANAASGPTADAPSMDPAAMVQHLKDRLAKQPDDYEGWVMLGRSLKVLNDNEGSQAAYAHAASLQPKEPTAAPAAPTAPAVSSAPAKDSATMVQHLKDRLAKEPEDFSGWMMMGRSLDVMNDVEGSQDAYAHAFKLKPQDKEVRLLYARELLLATEAKGQTAVPPAAAEAVKALATEAPGSQDSLYLSGLAARVKGNKAEARKDWAALINTLAPDSEARKQLEADLKALGG